MGLLPLVVLASGDCARPRGELFPAITPARVWPAPPDVARIRLLGDFTGSEDLRASRSGLEVMAAALRGPRPPIRFSGPHAIALASEGRLAVADSSGAAVHVLDLDARSHIRITGTSESEPFGSPVGVTWANGNLFVSDAERHEVIVLNGQGGFIRRFGADILGRPVGIAYVPARNAVYVVDGQKHHIAVFAPHGDLLRTIGARGTAPGEFNYPSHLACRQKQLLVADSGNFRVQLLDLDGRCLRTIGQVGNAAGDLSLPKGVAFDSDGHVYVVDAHFENIQIFDANNRLLMAFGQEGPGPGEFSLPAGLAIDDQDRIWVADSGNRRVQVFQYLGNAS
jgi:DNA-binding beta-propeller fold protein YncE